MTDDLALIKRWEGFRSKPYQDVANVWTIGYGTIKLPNGTPVGPDTLPIDKATATEWLQVDCRWRRSRIRALAKVHLTSEEAAALLSFVYNLGVGAFAASTLLRKLNRSDYQGAADQFPRWCNAGGMIVRGLELRRAAERALFLTRYAEVVA